MRCLHYYYVITWKRLAAASLPSCAPPPLLPHNTKLTQKKIRQERRSIQQQRWLPPYATSRHTTQGEDTHRELDKSIELLLSLLSYCLVHETPGTSPGPIFYGEPPLLRQHELLLQKDPTNFRRPPEATRRP